MRIAIAKAVDVYGQTNTPKAKKKTFFLGILKWQIYRLLVIIAPTTYILVHITLMLFHVFFYSNDEQLNLGYQNTVSIRDVYVCTRACVLFGFFSLLTFALFCVSIIFPRPMRIFF